MIAVLLPLAVTVELSQYLTTGIVTGKTLDVINIPIIPNAQVVQYSARDVTALPTSSAYTYVHVHTQYSLKFFAKFLNLFLIQSMKYLGYTI